MTESEIRAMHALTTPKREASLSQVIEKIAIGIDPTAYLEVYPINVGYHDESRRIDVYCGLKHREQLNEILLQEIGLNFINW